MPVLFFSKVAKVSIFLFKNGDSISICKHFLSLRHESLLMCSLVEINDLRCVVKLFLYTKSKLYTNIKKTCLSFGVLY